MTTKRDRSLSIKTEIEIEVRDKNGKLIEYKRFPSHSWVKNFLAALRGLFAGGLTYEVDQIRDLDGVPHSYPAMSSTYLRILVAVGGAGQDNKGILFGTGDTPVTPDDYDLASRILEGTGSNQMNYGNTTLEEITAITNGYQFRIVRTATNNSGASITVKEIGLAANYAHKSDGEVYFLLARDVLPSAITVSNGSTLTVRYIISFTVS